MDPGFWPKEYSQPNRVFQGRLVIQLTLLINDDLEFCYEMAFRLRYLSIEVVAVESFMFEML